MEFFACSFFVSLFRSSQVETILKAESQIKCCCFQTVICTERTQNSLTLRAGFIVSFLLSFYNDILRRFEFLTKWQHFLWTKVVAETASPISLWIAGIESALLLCTRTVRARGPERITRTVSLGSLRSPPCCGRLAGIGREEGKMIPGHL